MNRAAILIGVDRTGGLPELAAATRSAEAMHFWARSQGMQTVLLTDRGGPVDAVQVRRAVKAMIGSQCDQLLLYFAGHGINLHYNEYWLLSDAPDDPQAAVNVHGSARLAAYAGIGHVVFISDACRSFGDSARMNFMTGSVVFPNEGRGGTENPVDQFYACTLGRPAYEVRSAGQAEVFAAAYTGTLLKALKGHIPEAIDRDAGPPACAVVRPRRLKRVLAAEVPRSLGRAGVAPGIFQVPDAHVVSDEDAYLSRLDAGVLEVHTRSHADALGRPARVRTPSAPDLFAALLHAALEDTDFGAAWADARRASRTEPAMNALLDEVEGLAAAQPVAPPPWAGLDGCVFGVRGAAIAHAQARGAELELLGGQARVRAPAAGQAWVLLEFADGRGTLLPVVVRHAVTLHFGTQGELLDIDYAPVAAAPRKRTAEPGTLLRQRLRALAAVASSAGPLRCVTGDAARLAALAQRSGRVDPALALYAAYADSGPGRQARVRSLAQDLRRDLGRAWLDLDLLAAGPGAAGKGADALLLPFPALSSGWAALPALGIALPAALSGLERTLADSPWSLFDADGVHMLRRFIEETRS